MFDSTPETGEKRTPRASEKHCVQGLLVPRKSWPRAHVMLHRCWLLCARRIVSGENTHVGHASQVPYYMCPTEHVAIQTPRSYERRSIRARWAEEARNTLPTTFLRRINAHDKCNERKWEREEGSTHMLVDLIWVHRGLGTTRTFQTRACSEAARNSLEKEPRLSS